MQEGQEEIYYINGPSRAAVEHGPYVEMFKQRGIEIIYTLEPIDDFVLNHLGEYEGKKLVSADRADLRLPDAEKKDDDKGEEQGERLDERTVEKLCRFFKDTLGDAVQSVKPSNRLVDSPAMIVNVDGFMTSSMERIMQAQGGEEQLAMAGKKDWRSTRPARSSKKWPRSWKRTRQRSWPRTWPIRSWIMPVSRQGCWSIRRRW